jgi:antibiotic biosynthesis monooxygenase (ABM) superfamily enzyme
METLTDATAGVIVTCRVPRARVPAFEAALRDILRAGAGQPGHVSAEVLRGAPGARACDYHIIYRFADAASLAAWEAGETRRSLLARLAPLMEEAGRRSLSGLEAWFDLPQDGAPPSRHRMAAVTWLGIWPLVSLALWQLAPHLGALPFLARTAITSGAVVLAMTYLVMPRLARLADPWLRG